MNLHQPVMEAHRDLAGRVYLTLYPRLGVVKQLVQRDGNLIEGDSEIPSLGVGGTERGEVETGVEFNAGLL